MTTDTSIYMMAHLWPKADHYEECVDTALLANRIREVVITPKQNVKLSETDKDDNSPKNSGNVTPRTNVSQKIQHHVEMTKILEIENTSLRDQLTNIEMEHKRKLNEMATMLGLDIDLVKLLEDRKSGKNCPELATFEKQKTAIMTSENLKVRIRDIEHKINDQKKKLNTLNDKKKQTSEKHEKGTIMWQEKIDEKNKEILAMESKFKKELRNMNDGH
jgi:hypothetical protein